MNKIDTSNITVIVRSTGERTEQATIQILETQLNGSKVHLIKNYTPNIKAIKKSFEIGIDDYKEWTLRLDADVLPRSDLLKELVNLINAKSKKENLFEIHTKVLDKFFGGERPAGVYLYRTDLLKIAIKEIPVESTNIRPDATTVKRMRDLGYPYEQTDFIVGIHDFEQFYYDIFKKSFIQAIKHAKYMKFLQDYWKRMLYVDKDFKIALGGLEQGLTFGGELMIDKNFLNKYADQFIQRNSVIEKSEFKLTNLNIANNIITSFNRPDEYYQFRKLSD